MKIITEQIHKKSIRKLEDKENAINEIQAEKSMINVRTEQQQLLGYINLYNIGEIRGLVIGLE